MNILDLLQHLLSFALPALGVGAIVALAARWMLPQRPGWWRSFVLNSAVGLAVLAAGLWYFGRDGKMATYLALVAVVATTQWLAGRGWRG